MEEYNPPTLKNPQQSHIMPFSKLENTLNIVNGSYSNDFALVENCKELNFSIKENQILRSVLLLNNEKLRFSILDSAVVYSRTIRVVNCTDAIISVFDADIRRIELWDCKNVSIAIIVDQVQFENMSIIIHSNNENITISYLEAICDYVKLIFKNEVLNKIVLVQCIKVPLFSVNTYDINDPFFKEKFSWIKYVTKTLEFSTEEINKKLHEIVSSKEVLEAINELKKIPYTLTKEEISAQYDK